MADSTGMPDARKAVFAVMADELLRRQEPDVSAAVMEMWATWLAFGPGPELSRAATAAVTIGETRWKGADA